MTTATSRKTPFGGPVSRFNFQHTESDAKTISWPKMCPGGAESGSFGGAKLRRARPSRRAGAHQWWRLKARVSLRETARCQPSSAVLGISNHAGQKAP